MTRRKLGQGVGGMNVAEINTHRRLLVRMCVCVSLRRSHIFTKCRNIRLSVVVAMWPYMTECDHFYEWAWSFMSESGCLSVSVVVHEWVRSLMRAYG